MMDQQSKFASLGLLVEYVGESQNDKSVIQRVLHGQVQLVYITPENIMDNPMYRNMLLSNIYREKLVGLIVDEAHCVKLYGGISSEYHFQRLVICGVLFPVLLTLWP